MQYLRQSLLTICICLYAFLAVALGLNFLVGRADEATAVGFYHPDLAPEITLEALEAEDLVAPWLESATQANVHSCDGETCF